MAVGRDSLFFGRFEPLLFRAVQIPVSADALNRTLILHAKEVAAVIIEPLVQGAGGMCMHSPGELQAIALLTKLIGTIEPVVFDEPFAGSSHM